MGVHHTDSTLDNHDDPLSALRRRVAELEHSVKQTEDEWHSFESAVSHAPAFISRLTPDGRLIYANAACEQIVGKTTDELTGVDLMPQLYPGELYEAAEEYFRIAAEGRNVRDYELMLEAHTGERRSVAWNSYHRFGPEGLEEVISFGVDITEWKRQELERRRLQEDIIAIQAATLAELSTPLIPIHAKIVAMPLIGAITGARAQQIVDKLLAGIHETRARFAILDITGVAVIDSHVTEFLLRAARGVRLLGAELIITGIRPEIAQVLTDLELTLEHIVTRATLQSGIAAALKGLGAERARATRT